MKKLNATFLMVSALAVFSVHAASDDFNGTYSVVGNLYDATCTIDAAQLTRTIDLPRIHSGAASTAPVGSVLNSQDFDFDFTTCPAGFDKAGIKFSYNADANHANYMANTGDATGVLLGISDVADTTAIASGTTLKSDIDTTAHTAKVQAKVNAYRVSGTVAEGAITSVSQVIVAYE